MKFDYLCQCGKEKEIEKGMNDNPIIVCECGKVMKRKVSSTYQWGFHPLRWSMDYPTSHIKNGGTKK